MKNTGGHSRPECLFAGKRGIRDVQQQGNILVGPSRYLSDTYQEEYDAACNPSPPPTEAPSTPHHGSAPETDDRESSPGITIGPYQNCHYVASGVTAEVYRSRARAL